MKAAYRRPTDEVVDELDVDPTEGLSSDEARRRLREHGPNELRRARGRSSWDILVDQFKSVIILLLFAAAAVSAAFGDLLEAAAISAALMVDAAVGFVMELRARRSMEALRELGETVAKVRRDGRDEEVPAGELVPGDVVVLEAGAIVPADLRLIEVSDLTIDEAALTGESVPVPKSTEPVDEDVPIAERSGAAHRGTAVAQGAGVGVVVATGMETEIGHVAELVEEAEEEATPLERRLDQLGHRLIWVTFGLAGMVAVSGVIGGRDLALVLETAVILGIAAVPEGLPIVASLALARGVQRMARHNALVKRLSAVETLGSASIIMTDKTGTLTRGEMTVSVLTTSEGRRSELEQGDVDELTASERRLVSTMVLCTEADAEAGTGDPTELALLDLGEKVGLSRSTLEGERPRERVDPFDRDRKMMASWHRDEIGLLVAVKGAPEAVLEVATRQMSEDGDVELDDDARAHWLERNAELAAGGLRCLAVACAQRQDEAGDAYEDLTFLGLVGLLDPPRDAATAALDDCRRAGIRVIMLTGDQPPTAEAIARSVGLVEERDAAVVTGREIADPDEAPADEQDRLRRVDVFARVSPEDKLDLVALHQQAGAIVAMTGDGVNDAPALEKADIGVAMGEKGTDVAKDAADIVLLDDAFDTIVTAVRQGRAVFANIRKFVVYLLSGNLAEVLAVTVATLAGLPLPLLPLQILYINFVSDIFPALALGLGEPTEDVMDDPPRDPDEPVLTRPLWGQIGAWGVVIATTVMAALLAALWWLEVPEEQVVAVSFLTFGFARIWHTFNMRQPGSGILRNEVTTNRYVWMAVAIGVALMLGAAYAPGLSGVLDVRAPNGRQWGLILAGSFAPLLLGELYRAARGRSSRTRTDRADARQSG